MLKYYKELFLYVKDKIPNKDNAQDIVQETYEKIISIKDSKEIENERALLYKVTKNIIIDRLRKNKNYKKISYEEENFISQSKTPEDLAIEQNQQDILIKELKKLPPKRKEAFVLHILEGYTKEEITNIMGISYLAIKKRISRATIELREKLRKKEEI